MAVEKIEYDAYLDGKRNEPAELLINTADIATLDTTHPVSEYPAGSRALDTDTGNILIQRAAGWTAL